MSIDNAALSIEENTMSTGDERGNMPKGVMQDPETSIPHFFRTMSWPDAGFGDDCKKPKKSGFRRRWYKMVRKKEKNFPKKGTKFPLKRNKGSHLHPATIMLATLPLVET